jgi:hypothetical protein
MLLTGTPHITPINIPCIALPHRQTVVYQHQPVRDRLFLLLLAPRRHLEGQQHRAHGHRVEGMVEGISHKLLTLNLRLHQLLRHHRPARLCIRRYLHHHHLYRLPVPMAERILRLQDILTDQTIGDVVEHLQLLALVIQSLVTAQCPQPLRRPAEAARGAIQNPQWWCVRACRTSTTICLNSLANAVPALVSMVKGQCHGNTDKAHMQRLLTEVCLSLSPLQNTVCRKLVAG